MRHAINERSRFSRTRPGDDQKRPVAVGGCGELLRVELAAEVATGRRNHSLAAWTEAELVSHDPNLTS
jgi:hypothetical protein